MSLFKWSDSNEVYMPEIDAEHRALFQIGKDIEQALAAGAGIEQLKPMVEALMASAEDHFAHEERLMQAARYSAFEWHKRQHDAVRRRMLTFLSSLEQGDPDAPKLLLEYVSDWICGHTATTDRMMAAALRNYQRKRARLTAA